MWKRNVCVSLQEAEKHIKLCLKLINNSILKIADSELIGEVFLFQFSFYFLKKN